MEGHQHKLLERKEENRYTFKKCQQMLCVVEFQHRLMYLVELSRQVPDFPEEYKIPENRITSCVSSAYLKTFINEDKVSIMVDSDARFVRGLLFVLSLYVKDKTKEELTTVDPQQFFKNLNIDKSVTSQRLNGLYGAIVKLQEDLKNYEK